METIQKLFGEAWRLVADNPEATEGSVPDATDITAAILVLCGEVRELRGAVEEVGLILTARNVAKDGCRCKGEMAHTAPPTACSICGRPTDGERRCEACHKCVCEEHYRTVGTPEGERIGGGCVACIADAVLAKVMEPTDGGAK